MKMNVNKCIGCIEHIASGLHKTIVQIGLSFSDYLDINLELHFKPLQLKLRLWDARKCHQRQRRRFHAWRYGVPTDSHIYMHSGIRSYG